MIVFRAMHTPGIQLWWGFPLQCPDFATTETRTFFVFVAFAPFVNQCCDAGWLKRTSQTDPLYIPTILYSLYMQSYQTNQSLPVKCIPVYLSTTLPCAPFLSNWYLPHSIDHWPNWFLSLFESVASITFLNPLRRRQITLNLASPPENKRVCVQTNTRL